MKNFGYFFKEGARSMFSHGFMSFAAIGVTVACLLIMGTFSLVAYNASPGRRHGTSMWPSMTRTICTRISSRRCSATGM